MLLFLPLIYTEIIEQCTSVPEKNIYFVKFYRDKCKPCERMASFLEEIDVRLSRNDKSLNFYSINCSKCDCTNEKVDKAPTLVVKKELEELGRLVGHNLFTDLTNFIVKNTGFPKSIFMKRIKNTPGSVVNLNERDFYTGFDGPWIILFYNSKSDPIRKWFKKVASEYASKLNVGELNGNINTIATQRFGLYSLPGVIALYNGLMVLFTKQITYKSLKGFVDELLEPVFQEINYDEFEKLSKELKSGHGIYIVFYKNLKAANSVFRDIAHEYKFRAQMYKTKDPEIIKKAGVDLTVKDLILTIYRNENFIEYPSSNFEKEKILEWVFHSHYPFLVRINNDNFHSVLKGIKPVVILLSQNDDLIDEFEKASEKMHAGKPFSNHLFAAIDIEIYSLFIPNILPGIKIPSIVILDPIKEIFYTDNVVLKKHNLHHVVEGLIRKYDAGRLPMLTFKKSNFTYAIIAFIAIIVLIACYKTYAKKRLRVTQF